MKGYESTIVNFCSAKALSHFMQANLHYASETQRQLSHHCGYWWKTPQETFSDGFGFCYDLAAFAACGLKRSELTNSQLLLVTWGRWGIDSNSGHFVCFYCVDNSYYSIDNGVLKGPFSFEQLLLSASRSRKISSYQLFSVEEIPYHTTYRNMSSFANQSDEVYTSS